MESLPIKTEKDGCGDGGQSSSKTQQNQGEGLYSGSSSVRWSHCGLNSVQHIAPETTVQELKAYYYSIFLTTNSVGFISLCYS